MAARNLKKLASMDAQLRLLVPKKVSEDNKLMEYDALLLDRFIDILQDLHGENLKETHTTYPVLDASTSFFGVYDRHGGKNQEQAIAAHAAMVSHCHRESILDAKVPLSPSMK
ncbi:phosphoenolpyruvate carboxylase, housekeeping isozyme-like [Malania oleifera]|uniref:phosphoenolpyruvate carboxylase, housekeeping isozyme-like n=1 Tax=Malania oleifera TaxID=397392 RepID=UPI0025AEB3A2|nr:phosphoenolpyruvate carboxylase, housekeeping isozyme-like [Malania oleifera]